MAELEFVDDWFTRREWFGQIFSKVALGRMLFGGEICYSPLVPAQDIKAFWHPGDSQYDRYSELPR